MQGRAAALAFVLVFARSGSAQHATHSSRSSSVVPAEILERAIPIRSGIGSAHYRVSTESAEAQAMYDQGLAYLHSYVWIDAARSFNQALRLDPRLALAYVGLSYAYGELNAPDRAHAAAEHARTLASHASEAERRRIEIRARQLSAEDAPHDAARLAAYRTAIDDALAQDPSDEELWLLRGVAEAPDAADRGQGSTAASVKFYERALALAPGHFAARHYLTHAFENTDRIDEALAHGQAYARMAPAIPHARHMFGHELRRAGRIDEAIAEFEAADRLETDDLKKENIPAEYDWHYHHNLDLLASSYQYTGKMARAEQVMKIAFALPSDLTQQEINKRAWPMFLIGLGRPDEALAAASVLIAHRSPLVRATGHVEAGEAMLASGRFEAAAAASNAALADLNRAQDGGALVATSLQQLQAEFFLRTGQNEKGRALLEQVIRKVRAAPGPDAWTLALFTLEAIARAARETGDWVLAAGAARQMLEHDPAYAGTHYALALAAEHGGDRDAARAEFALAARYWRNADPDLSELRDSRRRETRH